MSSDPPRVEVTELDTTSDAALLELLTFAAAHGTPRATNAAEYLDLMREPVAWTGFVARDGSGELRAASLPSITAAIGRDQVQLNAFLAPGASAYFDAVLDAVDDWGRSRHATHVTAHVSAPTDVELAAWTDSGFAHVGERTRMVLDLPGDHRRGAPVQVDGLEVVTLSARPELADAADRLWRLGHEDVPSALRFSAESVPSLREELDMSVERAEVFLAVTPDGEAVGFALLIRSADATVAGHRMTATAREWRGRGVASAVKDATIRWAAANGVTRLQASNDSRNAAMQAVNERFGYRAEYRLVLLRRAIDRR